MLSGGRLTPRGNASCPGYASKAGRPTVRTRVDIRPPPDFRGKTFADFMVLGMIMTAIPAINAIPNVVAAPPGIVTYNEIALPKPWGYVPR